MNDTEGSSAEKPGFWKRQYQLPSTRPQRIFDLLFGIVAPLLCVCFDPTVFRSDGVMGNGFLSHLRLFGYLEIAACTTALGCYLVTRRSSPLLAGVFLGGFLFALILGIVMLPLSLLGLVVFIGVLGFTPFVTSLVFLRNACRCWRDSSAQLSRRTRLLLVALGIALILGIPASLQGSAFYMTNRAMQALQSGSEQDVARAVQMLQRMRLFVDSDRIVFSYQRATDAKQRDRLARAFHAVTGRNVEERLAELND
jgi:hypothetical protein